MTLLPRACVFSLILLPGCWLPDKMIGDVGDEEVETSTETNAGLETETGPATTSVTTRPTSTTEETETETGEPFDPTGEACDGNLQDCPSGFKCGPHSEDGSWPEAEDTGICVPVLGQRVVGESCTFDGFALSTDDCDADSICIANGEGKGVCRGFCDDWSCAPGLGCTKDYDSDTHPLAVCLPSCDPLGIPEDDCGQGEACVRYGRYDHWPPSFDFLCLPITNPAGPGEPCDDYTGCGFGNTCMSAYVSPTCEGERCCIEYCNISEPGPLCAVEGTECREIFEGTAPPANWDEGYCTVPDPDEP